MIDLLKTQFDIEMDASLRGVEKTREALAKALQGKREAETAAGTRLIEKNTLAVMTSLQNHMEASEAKRGAKPKALIFIKRLGLEVCAHMTIRSVINGLTSSKNVTATAISLGKAIHMESLSDEIREYDNDRYKSLVRTLENNRKAKNFSSPNSTVEWYAKETLPQYEDLPNAEYAKIGHFFLQALLDATDLAEVECVRKGSQTINHLMPTESTLKFIEETSTLHGIANPLYPLMVVPPKDWEDCYTGGYLTDNIKNVLMVKAHRNIVEELDSRFDKMQGVADALNNAQKTAWKIDPWMVNLIDHIHSEGLKDYTSINLTSLSEMAHYQQLIGMAKRFTKFAEVYVPYQVDFRGRLYAVSALNPQGADWVKGIFRFARGEAINSIEEYWALAVHVANLGGVDKVSFDERVAWAEENLEAFWDYLEDPIKHKGWLEADKPFQFLQAIRDFVGFHVHGWGYESSVPVALDGSCSGIQHFGVMTRDTGTCGQVNLVPNDKPDDIYQSVADQVNRLIEEDLGAEVLSLETRAEVIEAFCRLNGFQKESLDEMLSDKDNKAFHKEFYAFTEAWAWYNYGVSRKVCKRSVMTFAYGSGEYGYGEQVMEDTLAPMTFGEASEFFYVSPIEEQITMTKATKEALAVGTDEVDLEGTKGTEKGFRATKVLASYLAKAIQRTVTKPSEAMKYIQAIARETAKAGLPVRWETPLGLLVVQDYRKDVAKRLNITIMGQRVRSQVRERTRQIDSKANTNGASPNFVHSLDATHLMMVVNDLAARIGHQDIALVHDSFGTHAAFAPELFDTIRLTMEELYEANDVLEDFKKLNELPKEVPEVTKGTYQLPTIYNCDYAFA